MPGKLNMRLTDFVCSIKSKILIVIYSLFKTVQLMNSNLILYVLSLSSSSSSAILIFQIWQKRPSFLS